MLLWRRGEPSRLGRQRYHLRAGARSQIPGCWGWGCLRGSPGAAALATGGCRGFGGASPLLGGPAGLPSAVATWPLAAGVGAVWGAQAAPALLSRGAQSGAGSAGAGVQAPHQSPRADGNFVNYGTAPSGCRLAFWLAGSWPPDSDRCQQALRRGGDGRPLVLCPVPGSRLAAFPRRGTVWCWQGPWSLSGSGPPRLRCSSFSVAREAVFALG